jgi:hypothetical protein
MLSMLVLLLYRIESIDPVAAAVAVVVVAVVVQEMYD